MSASPWTVTAKIARPRYALGERVLLELETAFAGPGASPRLCPEAGDPGSPVLEVRREDEPLARIPTAVLDRSLPFRHPPRALGKLRLSGTIDLRRWVSPLSAGRYEVVAHYPELDVRSQPVRFVVDALDPIRFVVEAPDGSREGERGVLRVERTESGARLVVAVPGFHEEPMAVHVLGDVAPGTQIALSSAAPGPPDPRRWAVALEGRTLRAFFVERESATALAPVPLASDLEEPVLLAALAGAPREPAEREPVEREPVERETWPALHVYLAGKVAGRPCALALALSPRDGEAPASARHELAAAPEAPILSASAVALSPGRRRLLVAVEDRGLVTVLALEDPAPARARPREVFATPGRLLGLDAAAEDEERARIVALVAHGGQEPVHEVHEGRVGLAGPGEAVRSRELPETKFPTEVRELRVLADARGEAWVLGVEPTLDRPALVHLGEAACTTVPVEALPWGVELARGQATAVVLHPWLGIERRAFPARRAVRI